jgi:hypothetical protein
MKFSFEICLIAKTFKEQKKVENEGVVVVA